MVKVDVKKTCILMYEFVCFSCVTVAFSDFLYIHFA